METKHATTISAFLLVAIALTVFVSRFSAVSRARAVMAPALDNGWKHLETNFIIDNPRSKGPAWQIKYDYDNALMGGPLSIYVSPFGDMTIDEVEFTIQCYTGPVNKSGGSFRNRLPSHAPRGLSSLFNWSTPAATR